MKTLPSGLSPDLPRSLANLAMSLRDGSWVIFWVRLHTKGFGHNWTKVLGKVLGFYPEEGSGHNWIVELDQVDGPVVSLFVNLRVSPCIVRTH